MIEEKDEELAGLRRKLENHSDDYMEDLTKVEETKLDTLVLHYSEEMSKNQLELRELRCKKMELESALHELQMSALSKVNRKILNAFLTAKLYRSIRNNFFHAKGALNNHLDRFLPIFDHPPTPSKQT